jgi:hypothetical protein
LLHVPIYVADRKLRRHTTLCLSVHFHNGVCTKTTIRKAVLVVARVCDRSGLLHPRHLSETGHHIDLIFCSTASPNSVLIRDDLPRFDLIRPLMMTFITETDGGLTAMDGHTLNNLKAAVAAASRDMSRRGDF